ncbi:hypothetical protein L208DRAFT_1107409, partial [Tricholoma matsutake]
PPILGGPVIDHQPHSPSSTMFQSLKRKREFGHAGFSNFEQALQRATENESNFSLKHAPIVFEDRIRLIEGLREAFKRESDVHFAGSYRLYDPAGNHKQRIQTMTHEIWKATGYRFTVKDHPRTKHGHKTRLVCSQDEAHRSKSSKNSVKPRTTSDGVALAKARYPCRSGLLISSRDDGEPGHCVIIVRVHHHEAHEPNYDVTLPPDMTQSIWESMGWGPNSINPPNVDIGGGDSNASDRGSNGYSSDNEDPPQVQQGDDVKMHDERNTIPLKVAPLELDPDEYQRRMRRHIGLIRDFCDGLEFQLPFNDYRMLEALEREGEQFLRLVEDCLRKEGRL